jgi:hypothetical protein
MFPFSNDANSNLKKGMDVLPPHRTLLRESTGISQIAVELEKISKLFRRFFSSKAKILLSRR